MSFDGDYAIIIQFHVALIIEEENKAAKIQNREGGENRQGTGSQGQPITQAYC